jgi:hypothetical protein
MIALPADISMELVPIAGKAILGLMMLGGCALLSFIAILAAIKNRPGIAAFTAAVLVFGLLMPAGFAITYLSRQSRQFDFDPPSMRVEAPAMWVESGGPTHFSGRISGIGLLVIAGVVFAIIVGLFRRSPSSPEKRRCSGRWWPVPFLLALPLLFFLGFSSVRTHRSESIGIHSDRQAGRELNQFKRQQEELARQTAEIEARLHRQIADMDIHELMDRFDAPRIIISAPPKGTISLLSNLPYPISVPVKSVTLLLSATKSNSSDAKSRTTDEVRGTARIADEIDHTELTAEADAAAQIVAGEAEIAHDSNKSVANVVEADSVKHGEEPVQATVNVQHETESPGVAADSVDVPPVELESFERAEAEAELSTPIAELVPEQKENPSRPEWVVNPPPRVGEVRREVIATEEWPAEDIARARDVGLMLKTYEYVQRLYGAPREDYRVDPMVIHERAWGDHRLHGLQQAGITLDFIEREIAKEEYIETVQRSVGPMMKAYTLLEFTPGVDRELRQHWDAYQRQERFAVVGVGAGAVLGLLGFCYGLLKVDTWTKGYYTKRLFLGVPAAIIGLGTLLAWIVDKIS